MSRKTRASKGGKEAAAIDADLKLLNKAIAGSMDSPAARAAAIVKHLHGPEGDTLYHTKAVIRDAISFAEIRGMLYCCVDACVGCANGLGLWDRPIGPTGQGDWTHIPMSGRVADAIHCDATPILNRIEDLKRLYGITS